MVDLGFYILFNSISVISGGWADDSDRLPLTVEKILPRAGLESRTTRTVGQHLTY